MVGGGEEFVTRRSAENFATAAPIRCSRWLSKMAIEAADEMGANSLGIKETNGSRAFRRAFPSVSVPYPHRRAASTSSPAGDPFSVPTHTNYDVYIDFIHKKMVRPTQRGCSGREVRPKPSEGSRRVQDGGGIA